tara:strand:- start:111 stop:650 length:540 start_codon:yes stop_codon:yes gene_type:complete
MKFYLLFTLFLFQFQSIESLGRRYHENNYSNYISSDKEEVTIKYYDSLNSCYQDNYLYSNEELYYEKCDCFKNNNICKYKLIKSDKFKNNNRTLPPNLFNCLNYYHQKNIDVFNKCLECKPYYINLDIKINNLSCISLFSFLSILAIIILIFTVFYIFKRLNKNKKKKYILLRTNSTYN